MEPPVFATASAGIFMFSLITRWLASRAGKKNYEDAENTTPASTRRD